jgi:trimeric autotransporter adhesin
MPALRSGKKDILSMKHRAVSLVLILSLLSYAAAGLSGCGHTNSLSAIIVTPLNPFVAKGTTLPLSVTAIFSDGLVVTSWTQVTWRSSNAAVATVNSLGGVTGVTEGTAVITATDIFHSNIAHSVTVSVTKIDVITISPPTSPTISVGTGTQQFTAAAVYSLQTPTSPPEQVPPSDVTTLVTWASSSTGIATISNVPGSHGIATAGSTTGTVTITATYLTTSGTATLTVQ